RGSRARRKSAPRSRSARRFRDSSRKAKRASHAPTNRSTSPRSASSCRDSRPSSARSTSSTRRSPPRCSSSISPRFVITRRRAPNDRESARLALLNAIGADQSSELVLADPLGPPHVVPAVDAALTTAREQRPELKELHAAEKQAELTLSSARARRVPRVELS